MESKDFQDNDLDTALRAMIVDSSLDDSVVDEIANSPSLWWSVKREIEQQRSSTKMPWPPVEKIVRRLLIGVPAIAAVALLVVVLIPRSTQQMAGQVATLRLKTPQPERAADPEDIPVNQSLTANHASTAHFVSARTNASRRLAVEHVAVANKTNEKPEVKSEFIALSYAQNPTSGQLVRVKVPSSMMVSVGLVQSVAKPSELVDAEVLLGDDGLTRAIRFIRQ